LGGGNRHDKFVNHRCCYNRFLKGKYHYVTSSFSVLEGNNYEIVLLELYPCSCKEELHARERWYIENNECVNKYIPTRTIEEYYQDNKEQIKGQKKKYYETNKEQIKEQQQKI
jgi:hypothetical protein